ESYEITRSPAASWSLAKIPRRIILQRVGQVCWIASSLRDPDDPSDYLHGHQRNGSNIRIFAQKKKDILFHVLKGLPIGDILSLRAVSPKFVYFYCTFHVHSHLKYLIDNHTCIWACASFQEEWPSPRNLKIFERAAEKGNFEAAVKLGIAYLYNEGPSVSDEGRAEVNGLKASHFFSLAECLNVSAVPFVWLFIRPPWSLGGSCCKAVVYQSLRRECQQRKDEEKREQALEMFDDSSKQGCLHSSYLLWENNKKTAMSDPGRYLQSLRQLRDYATKGYILVDWLVEVATMKDFSSLCLHMTIGCVDRYLKLRPVPRARLQLLGIACMIPTIVDYKEVLLNVVSLERRTASLYSFICELSLLNTGLCCYSPARLSAAAFFHEDAPKDYRQVSLIAVKQRFEDKRYDEIGKEEVMSYSQLCSLLGVKQEDPEPGSSRREDSIQEDRGSFVTTPTAELSTQEESLLDNFLDWSLDACSGYEGDQESEGEKEADVTAPTVILDGTLPPQDLKKPCCCQESSDDESLLQGGCRYIFKDYDLPNEESGFAITQASPGEASSGYASVNSTSPPATGGTFLKASLGQPLRLSKDKILQLPSRSESCLHSANGRSSRRQAKRKNIMPYSEEEKNHLGFLSL
ncbi:hypothetical protein E2320_012053, partial [Naja naja]